jgi:hypothetical protein
VNAEKNNLIDKIQKLLNEKDVPRDVKEELIEAKDTMGKSFSDLSMVDVMSEKESKNEKG